MTDQHTGARRLRRFSGLFALAFALPGLALGASPQTVVLEEFESGLAGVAAVTTTNSPAASNSNSVVAIAADNNSNRLRITDADGGANGARITLPNAIPGPGYYLFTAEVKVDNPSPVASYGMAVTAGQGTTAEISDLNAGYVMNLTGTGDAALGYQTIGAAINVPAGGSFPQDATIYFSTDVSSNDYNAPGADGNFVNAHRSNATAWAANSANAVYVDNIKRIGPGNMGEERHLWISVGDGFTNLPLLESYLQQAKANNFTAVDILARYRADAYYVPNRVDATYANPEPFGTKVGTTPASASNDPLQYAIDRGHELGLKVYISFSSFVVSTTAAYPGYLPTGSIMGYQPTTGAPRDMLLSDGGDGIWADPGRSDVREYTKNILMDIVSNYDIDGVVFDRVRYPGSRFGYNSGALAELGWTTPPSPFSSVFRDQRRDVIGDWIADCYNAVTTKKPWLVVGATPVAFGSSLTDTYNNVFQHWPTWTSEKVANRTVSFGCMDLMQPQFYRLTDSGAPESNATLMKKTIFGDVAVDALDFGITPGAYSMLAPLMYHPSSGDAAQSANNSQNFIDARNLGLSGFGSFAAKTTLADIAMIRNPSANSAGVDPLAGTPTKVDYLFKAGYDNVAPNAAQNFEAAPQERGSVILTWDSPLPAEDGDTADRYLIYKSTTQPVREIWENQVTKLPVKGHFFNAPVGTAGNYYYKIVSIDEYNNHGPATVIGPITVGGIPAAPADIISDDDVAAQATVVGAWTRGTSSADKYSVSYRNRGSGTGTNKVVFNANITVPGTYTISEWHPQGTNRPFDARHTITTAGGNQVKTVNQQINGGKWNSMGDFTLNAGLNTVTIDDVFTPLSGRVVQADAIKWSYVPSGINPPAAPTGLTAHVEGSNAITLSWQDNATNELGYELERTICGGSTVVIQVPANATSFTDSNLAPDTEYKYILRAWNNGAQSADSNRTAARTLPYIPADIIVDNTSATLSGSWTVASASGQFGSNYLQGFKSLVRKATFTFVPERTAVYEIYEWHIAGTNRTPEAEHIVTYGGGAQQVVQVNQSLNGSKWNKIGQWQFDGGVPQSVMITNNFINGTVVMADAIKVVYKAEPEPLPAAPSGLEATVISGSEVGLTWVDNAVNESTYIIERTKSGNAPEVIASVAADTISYMDTGLESSTQYTYKVRAANASGSSANSNSVTVTTLSSTPPDQILDNVSADLVGPWSLGTFSADRWATNYAFRSKGSGVNRANFHFVTRDTGLYEIFEWHPAGSNRAGDAPHEITHAHGTDTVIINQQINGGQWNSLGTYAFNGGGNYNVAITEKFTIGDSVMADAVKVVWVGDLPSEPPAAPSALTATGHGASQVDLSWTDNTENESGFQIVRNGVVLTTVAKNVTSYSDTAASECTPYTYTVRSVVYGIPSADSNAASVSLDATAPQITAPADVTVSTGAGLPTASNVALGQPVVADSCDAAPVVTSNAPAVFTVGDTLVTWTATDAHGNHASATQKVTVRDTEKPVLTVPADVQVTASAAGCFAENVALGNAGATDNTGAVTVSNDAPTTYPVGSTTVTWSAVDQYGNVAVATQQVIVASNPALPVSGVSAAAQSWDKVLVTWSDSPNETLYEIRYATNEAGPYTVAGSTGEDATQFTVTGLLPNTTYFFVVEARNACGSADSAAVSAKTPYYSGGAVNPEAGEGWESVDDPNAEGGSYVIRARRSTDDAAAWNFNVPVNGTYKVSVFIPSVDHLSTQANYKVTNGGNSSTKVINQRQNTGKWVALGSYSFVAGPVSIGVFQSNNSSNPVVVDGLKVEQLN